MRPTLCVSFALCTLYAASATPAPGLPACLPGLRTEAPSHGIAKADFDRLTRSSRWQSITIEKSRSQAEFTIDGPTYLARAVSAERIAAGRALMASQSAALNATASIYDVDPAVVLAIWGIESNYGRSLGDVPVLDAWLTRACSETGKKLWRDNVFASIRLLRDGVVQADTFTGSWSGAFGLTQFIPTSFEQYARDGDGDGRVDLYGSVPDAIASTANHLARRKSWLRGVPAAIEVRLPPALAAELAPAAGEQRGALERRLVEWDARGVTRIDGSRLPMDPMLGLTHAAPFFVDGPEGRAFLLTRNFDALLAYNRSTKYALSVALVAAAIEAP